MTRSQWLAEDGPRSGRCNWIKRLAGALFILVILWHMCSLAMYAESDEAVPTADEYAYTRESDLARLSDSDRRLNLKYCGRELCKWFFVYRHPEQESRAQTWFRVFSSAAQMLNRTVVLPHVGKSRIRSCAGHSFDFYYDVDALRERYPNITFVHQDQFVEWTRLRERVPTTRMLSIKLSNNITDDMTWNYTNMDNDFVKNRTCLNGARLAVESTPVNTTFLEMRLNWWLESGITPKLRNRIVSNLMATNPDVLLVESQNIHTTLFTGADTPPIPYAKPIYNTTNRLVDTYLRPFVAIHWRMELAPSENLRTCAQELVKFLPQFMDSRGIKNVYLATDYPIMGGNQAQSDTFDTLDDAHHEAFRIVNSSSLKPQTWVSLRDGDERFNSLEGLTELGGGLQGIVDKLVCTHADYFLTPPPGCRKPTSTWTSAVIEERKKLKENDHNIKNEVEEWSTMYDFVQRENVQTQNMRRKNEHRKNGHRKNGHRKNVHTKNV